MITLLYYDDSQFSLKDENIQNPPPEVKERIDTIYEVSVSSSTGTFYRYFYYYVELFDYIKYLLLNNLTFKITKKGLYDV